MFTIVREDSDLHAVRSAEGDRRITMVVSTAPALADVVQQCTRGSDKHGFIFEDVALVTGDQRERWLGDDGIIAVLDYAAPYRRVYCKWSTPVEAFELADKVLEVQGEQR